MSSLINLSSTSLGISNQLQRTSELIARSLERLSTGKRVNSARDDVAAFSFIQNIDAQIRGLSQSNLNINTAIGLLNTADAGLSSQMDVLQQLRTLAVQGSNGSLTSSERSNLNTEISALREEFNRIAQSTQFDQFQLLNGSLTAIEIQSGPNSGDVFNIDLSSSLAVETFERLVGKGSFEDESSTFATSGRTLELLTADVDGDGNLDTISYDSNILSVNLGSGSGSFGASITSTSVSSFDSFQVGDLNGDGVLDLVLGRSSSNGVAIQLGNGDGSFSAATTVAGFSYSIVDVQIADFDNDGDQDIAALSDIGATSMIGLLENNGSGSFSIASTQAGANAGATALSAGDFNNDGNIDFAAVGSADANVEYFLGTGTGSVGAAQTFTVAGATNLNDILSSDFNNDGILDLIFLNSGSNDLVGLALGNGDGTFQAATSLDIQAATPGSFAAADFNNDGLMDIVVQQDGTPSYEVYLNQGGGSFLLSETGANTLNDTIATGDFNSDGVVDLLFGEAGVDGFSLRLGSTQTVSAVSSLNVNSAANAETMIEIVDNAITRLSGLQAETAAQIQSLEIRLDFNLLLGENYTDAKFDIESVDLALETANLVSLQIQQQAQTATLTQANLNAQVILGLLIDL